MACVCSCVCRTLWYIVLMSRTLSIRLEDGLWERLSQVAKEQDRSMGWVVRTAVERQLGASTAESPSECEHEWVGKIGRKTCRRCGESM